MRFGAIEVPEENIIDFPWGLPGFPGQKRFVPIQHREDGAVSFLQSLEMPELTFIVADPFKLVAGLEVDIPENELAALEITSPEEAGVYAILTVKRGGEEITANLAAPLVVNTSKRKARQVILSDQDGGRLRYPLVTKGRAEGKRGDAGACLDEKNGTEPGDRR
jgi:flagellar assembly factor FliW